jgi:hypothetical protein
VTTQLTTLANVKGWLGLPDSNVNADDLLTRLITAASAVIESFLSRTIGVTTYTQRFSGLGANSQVQVLPQYPVTSVSSVVIDGVNISAVSGPGAPGYDFDDYAVYLIGYEFTRGKLNVSITWQAGYATVPEDIAQACIELIGSKFKGKDRIDEISKVIQGMQVNFRINDFSPAVKSALLPYRRIAPI